ncbi:Cdk-activating kinase assembly factor MAT1/Tfb3 protein [Dioscorea alata]|uniref:Cdk-activating kinase assembly factor MAT1/Tfb3 protein n=1 Tax=Dioscorea alata TaxID=55571 RepID=A0ACB7WJS2_DIOAL|nr:Cdk-activating kinase assembly factor MAT1/Tfb3 protein [Dioscorea alata]
MGSLQVSVASEFHDRKRFDALGNADVLAAEWIVCNSWVSGKKPVISRSHCYGGFWDDKSLKRKVTIPFSFVSRRFRCSLIDHNRFEKFIVSGPGGVHGSKSVTELVEEPRLADHVNLLGPGLTLKNPILKSADIKTKTTMNNAGKAQRRNIWHRIIGMKKAETKKFPSPVSLTNEQPGNIAEEDCKLDAVLSAIGPESTTNDCMRALKLLEKRSDEMSINFIKWMRTNGKLKQNMSAYNFAIRVLARKEDWDMANILIQEMVSDSDCQLNYQVFSPLIQMCAKRGLVDWGAKWFHMMLEKEVRPNTSTIGMLMGLYQRKGKLSEAEFTFSHMRACKIHCVTAYSSMITIYTRLGMYDKSEEIIHFMGEDEVVPDLENWLVRLNTYSQQGKLKEAESVLTLMQEAGYSPNIVAYNILITGYGKQTDVKAAELVFQRLKHIGLEPDETTYRSMIEGFGRADYYKEAMQYYVELKRSGFRPNSSNFYTMVNLHARHGDGSDIVQTLKDMRAAGCQYSSMLSSLLQAYERVGRSDKVPQILKASFYDEILVDQTSTSILVMYYVQNSLLDDAFQTLQEKRWKDSNYEDSLYHLLICSCKEASRYEDAIRIYNKMPQSDVYPNLHITSSMIDVFSILNRFTEAEDLYLKLKASGVIFDVIAYSIVVRMYIKAESLKDACLVLDTLENQKDIVPDKFLFMDMLRLYQQCGMLEKLANAYYLMLRCGVTWDEAMYNCVINCCGRALPVDEVSRLFNEMIHCGYAANTITFNVMLDIYGKAGFLIKARKVFWMAHKQHLADIISYNTIISVHGKNKDFKLMRYFVQRMRDAGYSVSLEAYNSMLDAYGKEGLLDKFNEVLREMKQTSCTSNHYTYNILINIYGKKGWIKEVADVLCELKQRGLEPDLYSYNSLIKAYGIAGMVEEAVIVVREMRTKGIDPDRVTYSNLVVALQQNENFLEAVKWSLWMKQIGMSK